jgi:hypothetical protein
MLESLGTDFLASFLGLTSPQFPTFSLIRLLYVLQIQNSPVKIIVYCIEIRIKWVLSITNTTTLRHRTNLVLRKPLAGMMRMEPMVTVNAKYNEPPHNLSLGGQLPLFGRRRLGCDARLGHRVGRAQPQRAHTTPWHMPSAPGTDHPRHGGRAERVSRCRVHDFVAYRGRELRGGIVLR